MIVQGVLPWLGVGVIPVHLPTNLLLIIGWGKMQQDPVCLGQWGQCTAKKGDHWNF